MQILKQSESRKMESLQVTVRSILLVHPKATLPMLPHITDKQTDIPQSHGLCGRSLEVPLLLLTESMGLDRP